MSFSWQQSFEAALAAAEAAAGGRNPRYAQLATVTAAGIPDVRTVIVCDVAGDQLQFNTDRRSAKARHISETPWVAVAWYLDAVRTQFRFYGMAREAPEFAAAQWQSLVPATRRYYHGPPPGTPVSEPVQNPAGDTIPESFMAMAVRIEQVDVLVLEDPHRRWTCFRRADGVWSVVEVVP